MKILEDRLYSKDHEWVSLSENIARVGVTEYAQDALGEVVFVNLPAVGQIVVAGSTCGEVESSKSVSDIYSPLSGSISKANTRLVELPGLINSDPYGDGWIFELKIDSPSAVVGQNLLMACEYRQLIEG